MASTGNDGNNGEKEELGFSSSSITITTNETKGKNDWVLLSLRVVSFLATASATIVMALNKQTKNLVVATLGNTPITATITAKFNQTPAFVFFIIANGNASLHNLVMIAVDLLVPRYDYKGLRLALIAILDMMAMGLASAGDGAATFMSMLGRNGNSHAQWNKICDKFESYCDREGAALIASFIGFILLFIITVMSIIKLLKPNRINHFNASRPDSTGVGGSSNPSPQTPIHSSSNSEFANTCGLDVIDLNNDEVEEIPQENVHYWTWKEDEIHIGAWLNVSTDHVVGTDQKGDTFWNRIHNYCEGYNPTMKRGVATRNIKNGSNSDDIKEFAGGSKRTKITSAGAYSSSSNPETLLAEDAGIDSPVHPQGSKKSKRRGKGKGKAQMSEDLSDTKSSIVKKLSLIEDFKIAREKEVLDERENIDILVAIKEKELQIQQEMKQHELQTQKLIKEMEIHAKEREMNFQVLNADPAKMSESRRALHEQACAKIYAKWFT
ncbi:hypothetical protein PIB30_000512 [Stylosanthes scabra]|uniref:CASP-like protein n=1 Tax=Stylosanthes scabra TaxID=79078 RepID=A0ABU6W0J7_9FABA|nr:hypothetical protein [Stylosanthes scabra]